MCIFMNCVGLTFHGGRRYFIRNRLCVRVGNDIWFTSSSCISSFTGLWRRSYIRNTFHIIINIIIISITLTINVIIVFVVRLINVIHGLLLWRGHRTWTKQNSSHIVHSISSCKLLRKRYYDFSIILNISVCMVTCVQMWKIWSSWSSNSTPTKSKEQFNKGGVDMIEHHSL